MSYTPPFMDQKLEYETEKNKVKSLDDWIAFSKKWFNCETWPARLANQQPKVVLPSDGNWSRSFWIYDLTPEARYEYFSVLHTLGLQIRSPNYLPSLANGCGKECPYCEMVSFDYEPELCPLCHRKLVYVVIND